MIEESLEQLPPKTTDLQRRFFEIWVTKYKSSFENGSLTKAYTEAGYSPKFAQRNAYQALYSSNLNKAVRVIMVKKNITLERLVEKHAQLLEAKNPFDPNLPDNPIQFKAWQEGMKIIGGYPVPVQKIDVHHSEEYHISIDDQKKAENTLRECIDVEAEAIEDGTDDNATDLLDAEQAL